MIRKGALLRSINDGDYLRPFLCEKRFLEMMPCVDNHNQMFCISRKKLSHYAKQQGISYRVILLGFRVCAMKDCQTPVGTITARPRVKIHHRQWLRRVPSVPMSVLWNRRKIC